MKEDFKWAEKEQRPSKQFLNTPDRSAHRLTSQFSYHGALRNQTFNLLQNLLNCFGCDLCPRGIPRKLY